MLNSKIERIEALEIIDSRAVPTLEVTITTAGGVRASASVPSGASTGQHEAVEMRDGGSRFMGLGVQKAVQIVEKQVAPLLTGREAFDQCGCDRALIEADGSANKAHFGANVTLAVSLAIAKVASKSASMPLYRYLGGPFASLLPCPMMNLINGGAHADNGLEFQEFMIRPIGAPSLKEAVRYGSEIFHTLKKMLKSEKLTTGLGDEGGFAPLLGSTETALELLVKAIEKSGYRPGSQISLALDCAASQFYKDGRYSGRTVDEHVSYLERLTNKYPIDSIEDGMAEDDWLGWQRLTEKLGRNVQLVADDLFVTNKRFLKLGIEKSVANAIIIKPNQVGTLTEAMECARIAQVHSYKTIFSHRSGETEETALADLAVAGFAGQIKTGSVARGERTAKYNRLIAIEAELGKQAQYFTLK